MNIVIASDHAGFVYKQKLIEHLQGLGHQVTDFGTNSDEACDYPDFILPAAKAVAEGKFERGIVLGGSGNGEAMAANRIAGVRCALCWNEETAQLCRQHNNANMISIGERMVDEATAIAITDAWLNTDFEAGRHLRRITKIDA
ncbi:MAG: ribose 5-phosphate isomerase B [Blastopirellula sp.]|nr:MAG: ribose 5-phosphate isomerase B [Blastopirellula sp.]